MRAVLWAAAIAAAALTTPGIARGAVASAAATLLEAAALLSLGLPATRLSALRRLAPLLSCGCEPGPSARSLPAAVATWLAFGPVIALARLVAAHAVALWVPTTPPDGNICRDTSSLLAALRRLLPAALTAGIAGQLLAFASPSALTPAAQIGAGALFAFFAAPCGLGAVALAVALRVRAPFAAAAFLCVAGIADVRAMSVRHAASAEPDALAYAALAAALGIVALRHGGGLLHPMLTPVAAAVALGAACAAVVHRRRYSTPSRWAPALLLAGATMAAPPPQYRATDTTMSDLFAGERLQFSGVLSRDGRHCALVRYAITCCRADAAPIVVRLSALPRFAEGTWLRADGAVEWRDGSPQLRAATLSPVAPPGDPFLYR